MCTGPPICQGELCVLGLPSVKVNSAYWAAITHICQGECCVQALPSVNVSSAYSATITHVCQGELFLLYWASHLSRWVLHTGPPWLPTVKVRSAYCTTHICQGEFFILGLPSVNVRSAYWACHLLRLVLRTGPSIWQEELCVLGLRSVKDSYV